MEVVVTSDGKIEAKIEGKQQDDVFEQIASFQEVFVTPALIKGVSIPLTDVRFVVRENDKGDKFYEQRYTGGNKELWGFKREYHMKKVPKGAMYVHTYLKTDEDKANYEDGGNGWRKWKGGKGGTQASTSPTTGTSNEPGF